jgi:6-phosphofructokinase 1
LINIEILVLIFIAIDINGIPIKVNFVKEIIEKATGADTRETILGHVQRGGSPSALDRYIVCIIIINLR